MTPSQTRSRALPLSVMLALVPVFMATHTLVLASGGNAKGPAKKEAVNLVGKVAPNLMGQSSMRAGIIQIDNLRREVSVVRNEQGLLVMENGHPKMLEKRYAMVLSFFATYCQPCIKEIPTFNQIVKDNQGKQVKFLYVNVDTEKPQEEVLAFAKANNMEIEMMFPSVRQAMQVYGVESLPRLVFINKEGKVSKVMVGFQEGLVAEVTDFINANAN